MTSEILVSMLCLEVKLIGHAGNQKQNIQREISSSAGIWEFWLMFGQ